jgi:hypothetical protein
VWRFSLQDTRAHQRRGFSSLAELTAFLKEQIEPGEQRRQGDKEAME